MNESRTIYNSKTVKNMSPEDKELILSHGVPLEVYYNGYINLGPRNASAIRRLAQIARIIYQNNLPIPPSPIIEFMTRRTCGDSKQDFSATVDGNKGDGKSYSSFEMGCRYGYEAAQLKGGEPTDYFDLDNCALLEDTEAISQLLQKSKKYQFIVIDDASVALGARDFNSEQNKNFNRVLTTCRTRRWVVYLNVPVASHIDKHIRELVDAKINVYKSFHDWGFNILKINSSNVRFRMNKIFTTEKRYSFFGRKFGMWVSFTPDIFDDYRGQIELYDKQRDEATTRILEETAIDEHRMSDRRSKAEIEFEAVRKKYLPKVKSYIEEDKGKINIRKLCRRTGLTDRKIYKLLAEIEEEKEAKKQCPIT